MPTMIIGFPGGRYHATPWGHHVNEGLIEWPPSPWRLLRTLIATGYTKLGWSEVPPAGRRLVESLARVLPVYQLPPASSAHSRHYMPIGEMSKGLERTTLVFDTWANVGEGELAVRWDCRLDDDAAELFARLVPLVGYLGRSESWVEARVAPDDTPFEESVTAKPHEGSEYLGPDWEQVPLQAAVSPESYAQWREQKVENALADLALPAGKSKPTKALERKRAAAVAPFPLDLIDCLEKDTSWWKGKHNWSQPPGARRVLYWRPINSLTVSRPQVKRSTATKPVEAMLLSLATRSRNRSALPHVRRTLPQAELIHASLVGWVNRIAPDEENGAVDCPELIGRDAEGRVLRHGHRHAHVLPLDLDGDLHLDHVLIWAPMGLGDTAQRAVRSLRRTWTKGGVGDLQVSIVGLGDVEALRRLRGRIGEGVARLLGSLPSGGIQEHVELGATVWVSSTPFVPPRHLKRRGRNTLEGQIQAELASRSLPSAAHIEILADRTVKLREYIHVRRRADAPPRDLLFGVRIEFDEPVQGPLALGYGCHFGLGLFEATEHSDSRLPKEAELSERC